MDPRAVPGPLLALAGVVLLLALVGPLAVRRAWLRWESRRRAARAERGERRAEALLGALGYEILGRQVSERWAIGVDGRLVAFDLRADYLVARDARRFVAEVKTGRIAPRLDTAATRRQLLEYRVAFDVDGVLLVDVEEGAVHEVVFSLPGGDAARPSPLRWLGLGVLIGLGAALAARG